MPTDREARAKLFNSIPEQYDSIRPGHPEALYDDLVRLTGLTPTTRILEIGCGTGKFTLPLARRGLHIDAVEPGPALAAYARHRLDGFRTVAIFETPFEDFPWCGQYRMVVAANSFHWLDPETRYQKVSAQLEPGGFLAICSTEHLSPEAPDYIDAAFDIYRDVAPDLDKRSEARLSLKEVATASPEPAPGFVAHTRLTYPWDRTYSSIDYIRLLGTYSGHLFLPPETRAVLHDRLKALADTHYNGQVTTHCVSVLDLLQSER